LIEGPQHQKKAIDLYYVQWTDSFPDGTATESRLQTYLAWIESAIPDLKHHRFRRSNELYALVGALDAVSKQGSQLSKVPADPAGGRLLAFEKQTRQKKPRGTAAQYVISASKHTDDLEPRRTRIDILASLLI